MTFEDNACVKVDVTGIEELAGDNNVTLVTHAGNVTGDAEVNVIDLQYIKNNAFQEVDSTTHLYDINCDGQINVIDLQEAKNNLFADVACD
jgi:hypothetical protein